MSNRKECKIDYFSDKVRLAYIQNPMEFSNIDVYKLDEFNEDNDFVIVKKHGNRLKYYEQWLYSCWEALLNKDEYKELSKYEALDKFINERFTKIAEVVEYTINNYEFVLSNNEEDEYENGILIIEMTKIDK